MLKNQSKRYLAGIILNLAFIICEIVFGILGNSLSLLADAGHNFSDVASLILSWIGILLITQSTRHKNRTYGFHNVSILVALINAILLILAVIIIVYEAIEKLIELSHGTNTSTSGWIIIIVALLGAVVNGLTAKFFEHDPDADLNEKGAYLHMISDMAVSLGVGISGVIIQFTHWQWLDPVVSIVIAVIILFVSLDLIKASWQLAINGVPNTIDEEAVNKFLNSLDKVDNVHDLHIWGISTQETALTCHLVCNDANANDYQQILITAVKGLKDKYNINHTTIQIETLKLNQTLENKI